MVRILPVCRAERKGLGEGIAARLQPPEGRSRQRLCDQKNGVIPQARTEAQSGVKSDLGIWRGEGRKTSIGGGIEEAYPFKRDTPGGRGAGRGKPE